PRLGRADDPGAEVLAVLEPHRAGRRERVEPGSPERLVGVDVADAGDTRLVEQERLQRRRPTERESGQALGGELARERLDPNPSREERLDPIAAEEHRL